MGDDYEIKGRGPRGRHAGRPIGRRHYGGIGDFGPGYGGRGRRRMRRGDVRAALLVLLAEEPRNGYGLIQEIDSRSDGVWRPSPGSVYPALSLLRDEGLVQSEEVDGGKRFSLTKAGEKFVKENSEKLGEPWANLGDSLAGPRGELRDQVKPLVGAVGQVMSVGTEDDAARAAEILADARRKLYGILAGDAKPGK